MDIRGISFLLCVGGLALLQVEGFVRSGGANGDKEVILDISRADASAFETFTTRPYQMHVKTHVPKGDRVIREIKEGGKTLWKASGQPCDYAVLLFDKNMALTHLLLHPKGGNSLLYYKKKGSECKSIEEDAFYSSFHKRVMAETIFDSIEIDTSKREVCDRYVITNTPEFPFLIYVPNVGYRIKTVKNVYVLWEAKSDDEGCLYTSFYPNKDPKVARLIVQTKDGIKEIFYHYKGSWSGWTSVNKEEYQEELKKAGFDGSKLKQEVALDLSNADKAAFYTHEYVSNLSMHVHYPLPGFVTNKVVDGKNVLWESSDGAKCIYASVSLDSKGHPFSVYLFVKSGNDRKVVYYRKKGNGWHHVDKKKFFSTFTDIEGIKYAHKVDHPKIAMSSFRNSRDLRVITYASTVENPKGDIIVIPNIRSHFRSDICSCSLEWNCKHFGFFAYPHVDPLGGYELPAEAGHADTYRDTLEYHRLDGMDALELSPRYEYEGTFTKFLNELGYNVYSLDMQSNGLSDSVKDIRCHANEFKDYVNDVMQFVSIVKKGKFNDPTEKWNEDVLFKSVQSDRKTFLLGNSVGGNIAVQAVELFCKRVGASASFVDGLIGLSTMLNIDCNVDTPAKRAGKKALKLAAWSTPDKINQYEELFDYGESFEFFMRFKDPLHYPSRTTFKALNSLFEACDDVNKNIKYYPKDFPTLFIHAKDDFLAGVEGPRELIKDMKGKGAKLVELNGSCHYLAVPRSIMNIAKPLSDWLEEHN